jgi:hypothetical protein
MDNHVNWVSQCHVVNAHRAFSFGAGSEVWDCSAEWTTNKIKKQTMFTFSGNKLTVSGCRADFFAGEGVTTSLVSGNGTTKFIEATAVNAEITDKTYEKHLAYANAIISRP